MSEERITYTALGDDTPDHRMDVLKSIYARAIERYEENAAGAAHTSCDHGIEDKEDSVNARIVLD